MTAKLSIKSGDTFGYWVVVEETETKTYPSGSTARRFICTCRCGVTKPVQITSLVNGVSISCGCHRKEIYTTHGMTDTPEYKAWDKMRRRCNSPSDKWYKDYGGRGIECRFKSFEEFIAEIGLRPSSSHSLDRIDNNGHYEKGNIRWATKQEQTLNRRVALNIEYNGVTRHLTEWADILGFKYQLLVQRMIRGWDVQRAFTTPVQKRSFHRQTTSTPQITFELYAAPTSSTTV